MQMYHFGVKIMQSVKEETNYVWMATSIRDLTAVGHNEHDIARQRLADAPQ